MTRANGQSAFIMVYNIVYGFIWAHFYYVKTAKHSLEEIAMAFGDKAFTDNDEDVVDTATAGKEKHEQLRKKV
ncbi:MFS sugar transporter [Paraphaeosphaeria sporulosa]